MDHGWTWSPNEDRETQKGVNEQEHGWWQAACTWGGFANEKPLCPRWRLTLWFRQAGSVSCLPCTFPIRGLWQASAEQSSPCDWEAGRVTERERGWTREEEGGGGSKKNREVHFCRVTSGSCVMQPFLFCLPHPGLLIQIAWSMMVMQNIRSVPSSSKQLPFKVTQMFFPPQMELKSGQLQPGSGRFKLCTHRNTLMKWKSKTHSATNTHTDNRYLKICTHRQPYTEKIDISKYKHTHTFIPNQQSHLC